MLTPILVSVTAVINTIGLVFAIRNYRRSIKLRNDHVRMWLDAGTLTYKDLQDLGVL